MLSLHYALPISSQAKAKLPVAARAEKKRASSWTLKVRRVRWDGAIPTVGQPSPTSQARRRLLRAPPSNAQPLENSREARFGQMVKRSEEHTSELQSLMRTSYAVFCLKQK